MLDGIDTLLVRLLVRLDMSHELHTLVSNSAEVRVEMVERDLQSSGNLPALAVLYSHKGLEEDSLKTWQVGHSTIQPCPNCPPEQSFRLMPEICSVKILHGWQQCFSTMRCKGHGGVEISPGMPF